MKVIKLDQHDVKYLLRLILENDEGTPEGELSDTKSELITQLKENINKMISDDQVGVIVSLFIFLLTDKSSELQMRRIGNRLNDHLEGGGKDTDFTTAVTSVLRPLTKRFVGSLVAALQKEQGGDAAHKDVWEHVLREIDNDPEQAHYDLKHSSTKNKLKQNAINRIGKMTSDPDVVRIFSMFLLYLTDKQTVSDLRALGSTYSDKLNSLVDVNDVTWTQQLIKKLLTKFNPLVETMADAVDEKLKSVQPKDKIPDQKEQQAEFQQNKAKINDIVTKYNIR